jgi:glyoxylase-like metal-dependent hydrolase (beta-lactamase superfamily II)
MIELETIGDVTRVRMSTRLSRAFGYTASAFLTRGVLIDTGFPAVAAEFDALLCRLRPRAAVVTHSHEDHAGNAATVARRGIPLAAAPETVAALRAPAPLGLYRRLIWGTPAPLAGSAAASVAPPEQMGIDGLALVPTPGHAHDHHVVWDAEREELFAADLFLGVKVRVAHRHEHPRLLIRSLRVAAALRPRVMFDAHRGPVRDPVAALNAKADWLEETVAAIDRRIADGWRDRAIARAVLGREDAVYYLSGGGMSRINLVRAVRRTAGAAPGATSRDSPGDEGERRAARATAPMA